MRASRHPGRRVHRLPPVLQVPRRALNPRAHHAKRVSVATSEEVSSGVPSTSGSKSVAAPTAAPPSAADATETRSYESKEERQAAFRELLMDKSVVSSWPWDKVRLPHENRRLGPVVTASERGRCPAPPSHRLLR